MAPHNGRHKSALDLAPLERDCMSALWPLGEGTVREIRDALIPVCPRAYTTIMTIMDRLAHKGVVERRKVGKAYVYRPNLTEEQARARAVEQVVENYFEGSEGALASYLDGGRQKAEVRIQNSEIRTQNSELGKTQRHREAQRAQRRKEDVETGMDETLL